MVEIAVAVVVMIVGAVVMAKLRSKRRRTQTPADIYPHW